MSVNHFRFPMAPRLAIVLGAALLTVAMATDAFALRGRLGAAAMFREDADFGAQIRWTRGPGEKLNLVPQAGYFFDDELFDFNLDLNYTVNQKDEKTRFYVLGGGNLITDFDGSDAGINLGAGLSKDLTTSLNGFVELKWVLSDLDGLALHLGLSF
ncbi:MAG: hypothetical protein FD129_1151 [bacterium]|nr:MAG: hypothetical protein FD129_1151 [bacterium]